MLLLPSISASVVVVVTVVAFLFLPQRHKKTCCASLVSEIRSRPNTSQISHMTASLFACAFAVGSITKQKRLQWNVPCECCISLPRSTETCALNKFLSTGSRQWFHFPNS